MASLLPDAATLEARKGHARAWFEHLRDDMCAALEAVEDALPAGSPLSNERRALQADAWRAPIIPAAGRWRRDGMMAAGCSKGRRALLDGARQFAPGSEDIPGADSDPRFWASGISLMRIHNPHAPTAHAVRASSLPRAWFGSGGDLRRCSTAAAPGPRCARLPPR
jgi:coproporphyrinogen III oxidase